MRASYRRCAARQEEELAAAELAAAARAKEEQEARDVKIAACLGRPSSSSAGSCWRGTACTGRALSSCPSCRRAPRRATRTAQARPASAASRSHRGPAVAQFVVSTLCGCLLTSHVESAASEPASPTSDIKAKGLTPRQHAGARPQQQQWRGTA